MHVLPGNWLGRRRRQGRAGQRGNGWATTGARKLPNVRERIDTQPAQAGLGLIWPPFVTDAPAGTELPNDGDEVLRHSPVGCVRGKVQVCDITVPVDNHIGTELERVVTGGPPDSLARDQRPHARCHHARTKKPERRRMSRPECFVERALGIRNDDGSREGELVAPARSPNSRLRCHDHQPGARSLDLWNGLHDTAKVGAADASPGVPREVDDGRMPQQVPLADDLPVGILEPEGRKPLHASSTARGASAADSLLAVLRGARSRAACARSTTWARSSCADLLRAVRDNISSAAQGRG